MRVGNFSLLIPEGRERQSGHVLLKHGQVYTLRLGNHHHRRCDAEVRVDGKPAGCFRLDPGRTATLERPEHDTGRFTFFRQDSAEALACEQGDVPRDERGLVQVTFRVERARPPRWVAPLRRVRERLNAWADDLHVKTRWLSHNGYNGDPNPAFAGGDGASLCPLSARGGTEYLPRCAEEKTSGGILPQSYDALSAGVTGLTGRSGQTFTQVAELEYDPAEETVISVRLVCDDGTDDGPRPLRAARANPVPVPV